jgi:hypothetical protein
MEEGDFDDDDASSASRASSFKRPSRGDFDDDDASSASRASSFKRPSRGDFDDDDASSSIEAEDDDEAEGGSQSGLGLRQAARGGARLRSRAQSVTAIVL